MSQPINRNKSLTRIPCADVFGRRRTIGLNSRSSSGRIALVTPAGESAVLSPDEARTVAAHLLTMAAALDGHAADVTPLDGRRRTG
jgi:hypothetical protein